jgi:hypothetical protein
MFLTPYQTTACSSYEVKGIQAALQRAEVHGDLAPAVTLKGTTLKGVYIVPPYVKDIGPFSMPLMFDSQNGPAVAVDVRGLTKLIGDRQFKVVVGAEYEGAIIRGALSLGWIQGGANEMRRFNDIAAKVFIRLMSESLSRRLNLGPYEQQALTVVTGLFYYSNFIDLTDHSRDGHMPQDEKDKIAVAVSRLTRISPQTVADFLAGDVPVVNSLDTYCEALRFVVKSPRLERVDAALIMTLMGGLWFGGNARQLMAVALEYPPVWLALIYQALTDRSFHGAQLTKMVETEDRNKAGANFIRDVGSYLEILTDE